MADVLKISGVTVRPYGENCVELSISFEKVGNLLTSSRPFLPFLPFLPLFLQHNTDQTSRRSGSISSVTEVMPKRKTSNVSSKSRRHSLEKMKQERSRKRRSTIKNTLSSSKVLSAFATSSPELFADLALLNVIIPMDMIMSKSGYQYN